MKLFTRSPKLALTYAGDLLVDTATQILDLHSQYLNKVGDINRHYMGVLRVGISYTCGLAVLPEILPQFRREFPMVEFSMFEGNSSELEDELAHGRVDLVIAFHPIMLEGWRPSPDRGPAHHGGAQGLHRPGVRSPGGGDAGPVRPGADITAFRQMPFILLKQGNRVRGIVDQYLSRCYFKPKIILETENTVTTLAMAREGWASSSVPSCSCGPSTCRGSSPPRRMWTCSPWPDPST